MSTSAVHQKRILLASLFEMQLSVVICTRNRASQLVESLRSLTRLRCPVRWELVIVDNGSSDETQDIIKNYEEKNYGESLVLKTVVEPREGLGRAHNRGWAMSRGDMVVFTDDDCYPAEDYPITIQEKACRQDLSPGDFLPAGLIHGANFACRRTALESVNGFDERFGPGALFVCEDVDIMARMLARGWPGAYDPRPVVYHHHRRKTEVEALQLHRQYDRGRG